MRRLFVPLLLIIAVLPQSSYAQPTIAPKTIQQHFKDWPRTTQNPTLQLTIKPATRLIARQLYAPNSLPPETFVFPPILTPDERSEHLPSTDPLAPNNARAALELGAALGIGAAWYWSNTELNGLDWQYQWTYESQRKRHKNFDGWRFDDNSLHLNSPGHPIAGATYYALARGNNLSRTGAFIASMLTSFMWEALVEYKEVVSLNDLVFTGIAGVPLGEAYHQLGSFFRNSRPTALNTTLAWIFGAPSQFHQWLDGSASEDLAVHDSRLGWPDNLWHRFDLSIGAAFTPPRTPEASAMEATVIDETEDPYHYGVELRLTSEIIDIPGFTAPEKNSSWQTGSLITQLDLAATFTPDSVTEFHLNTKLTLAGYFRQSIREDILSGKSYGYALLVGTSIAYRHAEYDFPDFRDRVAAMHFPGLSFNTRLFFGNLTVRLNADAHPDFAAIQSVAFPSYNNIYPTDQNISVLRDHGYYYAFGFSRHYRIEATYGALTLRTTLSLQDFSSIEGFDRHRDDALHEITLNDHAMTRDSNLEFTLPWAKTTRIGITSQHRLRQGSAGQLNTSLSDHRFLTRLILSL